MFFLCLFSCKNHIRGGFGCKWFKSHSIGNCTFLIIRFLYKTLYIFYDTFTGKVERMTLKDYQFLNEKGDTVRLSDWKGKKVLMDCWAKYCGVCRKKMSMV